MSQGNDPLPPDDPTPREPAHQPADAAADVAPSPPEDRGPGEAAVEESAAPEAFEFLLPGEVDEEERASGPQVETSAGEHVEYSGALALRPAPHPGTAAAAVQLAVFLVLCTVGGAVLGGSVWDFLSGSLEVVPFALLALLAYLGLRRNWALVLAWVWHLLLLLSYVFTPLGFSFLLIAAYAEASGATGRAVLRAIPRHAFMQLGFVFLWCAAGMAVAAVVLLPAVRRYLATRLPIDPRSPIHAFALSMVIGLFVAFFGQLLATGAQPAILTLIRISETMAKAISETNVLGAMLYGLVWMVPSCIIAVGFPVARSLPEALERLGFVRPTLRQVFGALAIAVLLAALSYGMDRLIGTIWQTFGWPRTDEKAFEKLFQSLATPTGAVVVGITAGIGEEMAVRGVLQPRLGILLSNLFFTSLHAFQYSFDGLLSVFLIGLALGFVRQRTNTTTSAIVHGTYDFLLVIAPIVLPHK